MIKNLCFTALAIGTWTILEGANIAWSPTPADNNLNNSANWVGGVVPGPTDTAQFNTSNYTFLTIPGGAQFDVAEIDILTSTFYDFNVPPTSGSEMSVVNGIKNLGGGSSSITVDGTFNFKNSASADLAQTGLLTYYSYQGGAINFSPDSFPGSASASNSTFNLSGGNLNFSSSSSAQNASITSHYSTIPNTILFQDTSSASASTIFLGRSSLTTLNFTDSATAQYSAISSFGNAINFANSATAGSGIISLNQSGSLNFSNNSTAQSSEITSLSTSNTTFHNNSTAGNALIDLLQSSILTFNDSSQAIAAIINANQSSSVTFNDNSQANQAEINLLQGSTLTFNNQASSGSAAIEATSAPSQQSQVLFAGQSTGGSGTSLQLNGGSLLNVAFTVQNLALGNLNSSFSTDQIVLNGTKLTIGALNDTMLINGNILDGANPGSTLIKVGTGSLTLAGTGNTYSGGTLLNGGSLLGTTNSLQGNITTALNTSLTFSQNSNGTFSGNIVGAGEVIVAGYAPTTTMTFSGNNTYSGQTLFNSGTLLAGSTTAFSGNSDLIMGQNTTLDLNGFNNSIASLSSAYSSSQINLEGGTLNLTYLTPTLDTSFKGTLFGNGGLTVSGPGQLTLENHHNTYSGATTLLQSGMLSAWVPDAFSPNSTVFLGNGGTLMVKTDNAIAGIADVPLISPGNILLENTQLTLLGNGSTTYSGTISGIGDLIKQGTGTLTLAGNDAVTFSGNLVVANGTVQAGSSAAFSPQAGVVLGDGVNSRGTLNLNDFDNTIGGLSDSTTTPGQVLLGNGTLTIDTGGDETFHGTISGKGGLIKQGPGSLHFDGTKKYSGPTTIAEGTFVGNTSTINGSITNDALLVFLQNNKGTFSGNLQGHGTIVKEGSSLLNLSQAHSHVSHFAGKTIVENGQLALNTTLGGSLVVINKGLLSGNGKVQGNLTLENGGTIAPGNSIGIIHVGRNYLQRDNTTYRVQINGNGKSSLIDVKGIAQLDDGGVSVHTSDGHYQLNSRYSILYAKKGVEGQFGFIVPNGALSKPLFSPLLSYTKNHVYLTMQTTLIDSAETSNQRHVAEQLDSITNSTHDEDTVLRALVNLPHSKLGNALDQLSGQQYTNELLAAELINNQFLRHLYDPVRSTVTSLAAEGTPSSCNDITGYGVWLEGGGTRSFLHGDKEASGFKTSGYEISGGVQLSNQVWTLGLAGEYNHEDIHYNIGGHGINRAIIGGGYALYRPDGFYFLGNLTYGYTHNKVHRDIDFNGIRRTAVSKPQIHQGALYGELGVDSVFLCLLAQPFLGFEFDYAERNRITEEGADSLNLTIDKQIKFEAYSRMGVHLTTQGLPWDLSLSLDLAWQCLLSGQHNTLKARFREFGESFKVKGVSYDRNCFDGAITLSQEFSPGWRIFLEYAGQKWQDVSAYTYLGGLTAAF